MKKNSSWLEFFRKNESGAIFALFAILLPVFFGFVALAIDVGVLYASRGRLQDEADAAALAGAAHLPDEEDDDGTRGDKIQKAIEKYMDFNNKEPVSVIYSPDTIKGSDDKIDLDFTESNSSINAGAKSTVHWGVVKPSDKDTERVRITITEKVPTYFINVITDSFSGGIDVKVQAAAEGQGQPQNDDGISLISNSYRDKGGGSMQFTNGTTIYNYNGSLSNVDFNKLDENADLYSRGVFGRNGLYGNFEIAGKAYSDQGASFQGNKYEYVTTADNLKNDEAKNVLSYSNQRFDECVDLVNRHKNSHLDEFLNQYAAIKNTPAEYTPFVKQIGNDVFVVMSGTMGYNHPVDSEKRAYYDVTNSLLNSVNSSGKIDNLYVAMRPGEGNAPVLNTTNYTFGNVYQLRINNDYSTGGSGLMTLEISGKDNIFSGTVYGERLVVSTPRAIFRQIVANDVTLGSWSGGSFKYYFAASSGGKGETDATKTKLRLVE